MEMESQFYNRVAHFFGHPFTGDQGETVTALENFLRSKHPYPLFILKGYAGTGKTSLLAAFIEALASYNMSTFLMAPTGKAAKILSQKSKKNAFTIHKLIYRRKSKADETSPLTLTPNLQKNTLFIVDEASMIGDYTISKDGNISQRNLLDDLLEYVYNGKNCRLIFIGDSGQLPPIGTTFSPALSTEYLENNYPRLEIHEQTLNQIVRQRMDSGIVYNATLVRQTKHDFPLLELDSTNFPDIVSINGLELQDALESSFGNYGPEGSILITRSNKRANEYNRQIRNRIFWYEEQINQHDLLMVIKNNYYWLKDQKEIGFLANGETMIVKRVLKEVELYGFRFYHIMVALPDYEEIDAQEIIIHAESLFCEGANLPRARMRELFFEVEKDYLFETSKAKRYERILANPYFNAVQVKFSYAVTCHKSQGGQWENVFIDVGYLPDDLDLEEYNRWLYTALTRASEKVYLVNFPEDQMEVVDLNNEEEDFEDEEDWFDEEEDDDDWFNED